MLVNPNWFSPTRRPVTENQPWQYILLKAPNSGRFANFFTRATVH